MRYPAVLFDFDGTLADSVRLIVDSFHHTMRVHGLERRPDDFWVAGLGTPLRVQFRCFTDDPAEIQQMIDTYRDWNLSHHDASIRAYPGAVETVRQIRRTGRHLGIVTSKNRHGLERGLAVCGFDGLFDTLVTCDDLEASKPSPEPVQLALARLGAAPKDALFVGDSPHDVAAGRAAGCATAACLWGPFSRDQVALEGPDHWLESFGDLSGLLAD